MDPSILLPLARKMLAAGWKPELVSGILNEAMAEATSDTNPPRFTTQDMEKVKQLMEMDERKAKAWLN